MSSLRRSMPLGLVLIASLAQADAPRQECIGRTTFEVPEDIQWATYGAERVTHISDGRGGHSFSPSVTARIDYATYGNDGGWVIKVSDFVTRSDFEAAAGSVLGRVGETRLERIKDIEIDRRRMARMAGHGFDQAIAKIQKDINAIEQQLPRKIHENDLGISDAYFLGGEGTPNKALLWRNNRVYYFGLIKDSADSAQRFKDLISRFRTRNLYEVPEGPGVCLPYGFIADDGQPPYSIKNSLRFTRTPNVIFTLIAASANDPWQTRPTEGTYDTDYRPGYDGSKWKISAFNERLYFGKRQAGLEGWRLDPLPGSGEEERAWFALAHTGGLDSPLLAVQMSTFQRGKDDLTDLTPPPEAVLPRFKALSASFAETLK